MDKYEADYDCPWCGYAFTAQFQCVYNEKGKVARGGCSAVKCPHCNNGLKPRIEAKSVRELDDKGNVKR